MQNVNFRLVGLSALAIVVAATSLAPVWAQPPMNVQAAVLQIDVESWVQYVDDTSDPSKFATTPNPTPASMPNNFARAVAIADIVAINGQPAKGTMTRNSQYSFLNTVPAPGRAIADTVRSAVVVDTFEILNSEGNAIGTIITSGLAPGGPAPGAPLAVTQGNFAIVGGTGAFLGARGQSGQAVNSQTVPVRTASVTEDHANRRQNGGGKVRWVLQMIPMERPEIMITANGPAAAHSSDFTLVTASKPATAGEILSFFMTGLGPTKPGVDPGKPFPPSPVAVVNSPVEVTVNGKSAEVLAAAGYPGAVDGYQVNFRVPSDTAPGTATIQVTTAWIAGPAVQIAIR
jgi:uncharacterized protein (TIGR03437 family)